MFFWNSLAFSMILWMLAIWSLVPLPFLNAAWTSGSSCFTYCWSLTWRIWGITLLVCEMRAIVWYFEHSLVLPFFEIGVKTDLFQSCGHCWVFQVCWHIECSTFTASSFRIWDSSVGIPSPPPDTQLLTVVVYGDNGIFIISLEFYMFSNFHNESLFFYNHKKVNEAI